MVKVEVLRGELPQYGSGYGYGYGYGYGSGYGYGYGSGSGYGSGYGDGDGYGSGYGYGDGYGSGYGYGYGYGYGDGDGDGYGDGDGEYWTKTIQYFAAKWNAAQQSRLTELRALGAKIAFWRSDAEGRPCNGGKGDPVKPGDVQKIAGPLKICTHRALHATEIPPKWQGERVWIVALVGELQNEGDKWAALERVILGEAE